LGDPDSSVRQTAEGTLVEICEREAITLYRAGYKLEDVEATELHSTAAVLGSLQSDSAAVRRGALAVFERIQMGKQRAEAALRGLLADPDQAVRERALGLLNERGMGTLDEIREALLREFPPDEASFAPALPGMPSSKALAAIAGRGPAAAELLPDVISIFDRLEILQHQHIRTSSSGRSREFDLDAHVARVLATLAAMQTAAQPAVPHLLKRIPELDDFSRIKFAETLFTIAADPADIVPILTANLTAEKQADPADYQALSAAHLNIWDAGKLLVRVSPEEARRQVALAIPRLGGETSINKMALFAIYGLAPEARDAIPVITPLLKHSDQQVSGIAVEILRQIGPEAATVLPELVARLESAPRTPPATAAFERIDIVRAIGNFGARAKSAAPALTCLLNDSRLAPDGSGLDVFTDPHVRLVHATIEALGRLGDDSQPALAALRARLNDGSARVRVAALKSLGALGRNSETVLRDFLPLLGDETAYVRTHAALEIGDLAGDRTAAVPRLSRALRDENPCARTAAAMALGKIGPAAREALPALRALLTDSENSKLNQRYNWGPSPPEDRLVHVSSLDGVSVEEAAREAIAAIEDGANDE
jgi:HEAT repeat protein